MAISQGMCGRCAGQFSWTTRKGGKRRYCDSCRVDARKESLLKWRATMQPCSVDGCEKLGRSRNPPYCEMHYGRLRTNGHLHLLEPKETLIHSGGYIVKRSPAHPLCTPGMPNYVYEHRATYYAEHGDGPFRCHWCTKEVTWSDMHVDHLNDTPSDNRIENLVASCPTCNTWRGKQKMAATKRRQGRLVTAFGRTMCVSEWAREVGVAHSSIAARLKAGWPVERALSEPRGRFGPK